jgi:hypothetical protein
MAFNYKKFYSELMSELPGQLSPSDVEFLQGQPIPSEKERPDLFGDLSKIPIGNQDAQNTAQRSKSKSEEIQDAYKAVMENIPKIDAFQKNPSELMMGFVPSEGELTPVEAMTMSWDAEHGVFVSGAQLHQQKIAKEKADYLKMARSGNMPDVDRFTMMALGSGLLSQSKGFSPAGGRIEQPEQPKQKSIRGDAQSPDIDARSKQSGLGLLTPQDQRSRLEKFKESSREGIPVSTERIQAFRKQNPYAGTWSPIVKPEKDIQESPSMSNTQFGQKFTEEEYNRGKSFLQNLGYKL